MSKKFRFFFRFSPRSHSWFLDLNGVDACCALHALYSPDFCFGLDIVDGASQYVLLERQAMTMMPTASIVGTNLPDMAKFNPRHICDHGGLYLHKSVIARLKEYLQLWHETDKIFNEEYRFGAPVSLRGVFTDLVECTKDEMHSDCPYVGFARWG